ncbi:MAG: Rieske 2Fe-2S domain-containing protein, partial [Rhodospirillales bacterium]|nr:Rieske 2Fe-2S domain-containing protein [Rhodospirillales bacterium]
MNKDTKTELITPEIADVPESKSSVMKEEEGHGKCLMSRRDFLFASGVTTVAMVSAGPGMAKVPAMVATYSHKLVAKLSQLKTDKPIDFSYPDDGAYSESMIVKLGVEAGGGIGPNKDIVAFNYTCTHQGGEMTGSYKGDTKSLGACPLHLSTYDLT